MSELCDVAIVGAGASGLAAAMAAKQQTPGKVLLLERLVRVGKKILVTGNGRCNLGNVHAATHAYHNRTFALPALRQWESAPYFRSLGLLLREDAEGRLYPRSNTAASVLDALRLGAARAGVEFCCGTAVQKITPTQNGFCLNNERFAARRVIVAAGGCAAPAQGSDGSGLALLAQLGHHIVTPRPALVALRCQSPLLPMLKGLRCQATIALEQAGQWLHSASGEILFTEDGISGIAAMELSRWAAPGATAALDLLPELPHEQLRALLAEFSLLCPEQPLLGLLPRRIGEAVIRQCAGGDLAISLKHFTFYVTGTRGFAHAQVTAGGADVAQFHAETLESKLHRGLFACGEVLDVDGGCGGFNLQWAFASGQAAGQQAGRR
jgi:predicted Rossmann fold flavoprotein